MAAAVSVKTEVFEGPFETLLALIEKHKLLINEVSLAQIADDFIAAMQERESFPIDDASEFIYIAATLILIKSHSLLPQLVLTEEEQADMATLELRLALYQKFTELSREIQQRFGVRPLFARSYLPPKDPLFVPPQDLTKDAVYEAMRQVIDGLPKPLSRTPDVVIKSKVTLEEMVDKLTARMTTALETSFREFSGHGKDNIDRIEVIVGFLALLELVKQGIIHAEQDQPYSDILMKSDTVALPRYG